VLQDKKLRECLGLFSTGIVIACARKNNFLTQSFFAKKYFKGENLVQRVENYWQNFLKENVFGKALEKKFFDKKSETDFFGKNFLPKLKKLFSDEFFGMTVNSFSSISLNPPLVSFCIDNKSSNLEFFRKNRYFSLNFLSQDQKELSNAFATPKNSEKWNVEAYFFGKFGNPIFEKSLGFLECKKHRVIKAGDHHIIIGEILDFAEISNKEPLIYYRGKYQKLKE
jgi:flavin reductase (DIM6/NTAB) family NADH-FMN oxidoreductase RutF